MRSGACGSQKSMLDLWELELPVAVRCPSWVLVTKLWAPAKAVRALNCRDISPAKIPDANPTISVGWRRQGNKVITILDRSVSLSPRSLTLMLDSDFMCLRSHPSTLLNLLVLIVSCWSSGFYTVVCKQGQFNFLLLLSCSPLLSRWRRAGVLCCSWSTCQT